MDGSQEQASVVQIEYAQELFILGFTSNFKVATVACGTPLPKLVANCNFSYSDHEAVVAQLRIVKSASCKIICSAFNNSGEH